MEAGGMRTNRECRALDAQGVSTARPVPIPKVRYERIRGLGAEGDVAVPSRVDRSSIKPPIRALLVLGVLGAAIAACAGASESSVSRRHAPIFASPAARAVVDAPDRSPEDRQIDTSRRPAELLTFLGVAPGMRVGELVAAAGYTAELLARAVAPNGSVYAENPRLILESSGELWAKRLSTLAAKNIVRVDRELDDPFPREARDLDLVVINLVYHDTVWMGVDREKRNRAVLAALKTGGGYAVIDHSARPGAGVADVQTLHRIDETAVRSEVRSVGFVITGGDSFLRNPSDSRDWNDSPMAAGDRRGRSDRFALLFAKP
jgi:predicted methyltransferase